MTINSFYKGQKLLYHCPGVTHEGVVNFVDTIGGTYFTLTVGLANLVVYPTWWNRIEFIDKPPCDT